MAEARGLLIESVASGYQSKGFQLYARLAGTALGETGDAYRTYLFSIFDELAVDLPVLFDRYLPQGLFSRARRRCCASGARSTTPRLHRSGPRTRPSAGSTSTSTPDERKRCASAAAAPRNSRELAVRNQFFTPRYVVEFLTDNTLGRIWYEMTQGRDPPQRAVPLPRPPAQRDLPRQGEAAPETPKQDGPLARKSCSGSRSTSRIARSRTRARSACSTRPAAPCTSASTPSTSSRSSTTKPGTIGTACPALQRAYAPPKTRSSATCRASSSSTTSTASTSTPAPCRSPGSPSGCAPRRPGRSA